MRIILALLLSVWIGGVAAAFDDDDRATVQSMIEEQLQAFLADDGARAYSFSAPGLKERFPTEAIFMEMVRKSYGPVYRPRNYSFGEPKESGGQLVQPVDIVDTDGVFWTALYTLQEYDGAWLITGCLLLKKPGSSA